MRRRAEAARACYALFRCISEESGVKRNTRSHDFAHRASWLPSERIVKSAEHALVGGKPPRTRHGTGRFAAPFHQRDWIERNLFPAGSSRHMSPLARNLKCRVKRGSLKSKIKNQVLRLGWRRDFRCTLFVKTASVPPWRAQITAAALSPSLRNGFARRLSVRRSNAAARTGE